MCCSRSFLRVKRRRSPSSKPASAQATIDMKVFPVNLREVHSRTRACKTLLDAVIDYLPSPLDKPAVEGHQSESSWGRLKCAKAEDAEPPLQLWPSRLSTIRSESFASSRIYSGFAQDRRYHREPPPPARPTAWARLVKMHAQQA